MCLVPSTLYSSSPYHSYWLSCFLRTNSAHQLRRPRTKPQHLHWQCYIDAKKVTPCHILKRQPWFPYFEDSCFWPLSIALYCFYFHGFWVSDFLIVEHWLFHLLTYTWHRGDCCVEVYYNAPRLCPRSSYIWPEPRNYSYYRQRKQSLTTQIPTLRRKNPGGKIYMLLIGCVHPFSAAHSPPKLPKIAQNDQLSRSPHSPAHSLCAVWSARQAIQCPLLSWLLIRHIDRQQPRS